MTISDQDILGAYYASRKVKAHAADSLGLAESTYRGRLARALAGESNLNHEIACRAAGRPSDDPHVSPSSTSAAAHIEVTERILVIGDTHLGPGTSHPDYLEFCLAIQAKHKLTSVLHVGDVADWSSVSYHEKEFWSVGPDQERDAVVEHVKPWAKAFPKMHITVGNHCDLPRRKLKTFGLPLAMLGPDRNYLIGGAPGWTWSSTATFQLECGVTCVMAHHFSSSWTAYGKMADTCCLIQGHAHQMGGVAWSTNPNGRTFAMSAGCGINADHPAFNYRRNGRNQLTDPVLGCGTVVNGNAVFMPMWLDDRGRWNGAVP